MKTKYVYIMGDLTFGSIADVLKAIDEANNDDTIKRIQLTIASGGGKLYAGFALYDYIKKSIKPVDTLAVGYCASASVMVLQAGAMRYAAPHTTFMVHPSSWSYEDIPYPTLTNKMDQSHKDQDLFVQLTIERSGMSRKDFETMYNPIKYLSAKEALAFGKHGLIDKILAPL